MGCLTFVRLIVMSVIFGLLLTTSDQGSDIYLMIRTYLFAGSTLGIVACKHCSMQEKSSSLMKSEKLCQVCTEENAGQRDGGLHCGANALGIEKLSQFQATCKVSNWSITQEKIKFDSGLSYCQKNDNNDCCVSSNGSVRSILPHDQFENSLLLVEKYRFARNEKCEVSLIIGPNGDRSRCNQLFKNSSLWKTLNSKCSGMTYVYKETSFTKGNCGRNDKCCIRTKKIKSADCRKKCMIHLIKRKFKIYGECCMKVKKSQPKYPKFRRCDKTVCERHIDFIKSISPSVYDEASWRQNFVIHRGTSLGGALCIYLRNLSISMFFPILIHWIMVAFVWLDDIRKERTHPLSIVCLVFNIYSQFRLIVKLVKSYNNESRLRSELEEQDLRVTSLECMFEAIFQVKSIHDFI